MTEKISYVSTKLSTLESFAGYFYQRETMKFLTYKREKLRRSIFNIANVI